MSELIIGDLEPVGDLVPVEPQEIEQAPANEELRRQREAAREALR